MRQFFFCRTSDNIEEARVFFGINSSEKNTQHTLHTLEFFPQYLANAYHLLERAFSLWRWHEGRLLGLDYTGLSALINLGNFNISTQDFYYLQQLETTCINIAHASPPSSG